MTRKKKVTEQRWVFRALFLDKKKRNGAWVAVYDHDPFDGVCIHEDLKRDMQMSREDAEAFARKHQPVWGNYRGPDSENSS